MRYYTYNFEVQTLLTQFCNAFNDITIKRYDNTNTLLTPTSGFNVNFVYAPKQRVYASLNTPAPGGISLPVVAVTISGISRDNSRVFNKLDGFNIPGQNGKDLSFLKSVPQPVPVNVGVNMSIITKYQQDMDQILSNFVPYCDPYVIISWKMPVSGSVNPYEIRSEVLWSGDIKLTYPVDIGANVPTRVTADTSFIIKGWLFKYLNDDVKRIYTINSDYHSVSSMDGNDPAFFLDIDSLFLGLSAPPNGTEIFNITTNEGLSAFFASVTSFNDGNAGEIFYNSLFAGHSNSNFTFGLSGY